MRVIYPGHTFELDELDGDGKQILQFVQREPYHDPKPGVLTQEVIRALIARNQELDDETPWEGNEKIRYHLRMALLLHEFRAMERDVLKGTLKPERVKVDKRGHFDLQTM